MAIAHKVENNQLVVAGRTIKFECKIAEIVETMDRLIVRLDNPGGTQLNRNIYALGSSGEKLWQIEESPYGGVAENSYVRLWMDEHENICASVFQGIDYIVNVEDGSVSAAGFRRF